VKRKTAFLFAGCMKLAAIASGRDSKTAECLSSIGMNLGMAFQLVDDSLDLTASQNALGKPVGSDLKEGKLTLPVSWVLRNGDREAAAKIRKVLAERSFESVSSKEVLTAVEKSNGLGQTRAIAEDYVRQAKSALGKFPQSQYRDAIISIPDFILNRTA